MDTITLKDRPDILRIVRAAFPGYKKHKAFLSEWSGKANVSSYWDGGSRDEYAIVRIADGARMPLPTSSHPYFDVARHGLANQTAQSLETDRAGNLYLTQLPPGFALVSAGTFCGKPATAHVRLSPMPAIAE